MKRAMVGLTLVGALVAGCEETEECRRLSKLQREQREVLGVMKSRAGLADKAVERAERARTKATKVLSELGLDESEAELSETLKSRAQAAQVNLSRGSRQVAAGTEGAATSEQTVWSFELKGDVAKAMEASRDLAEVPPLTNFVAFLGDDSGKSWRLRLGRPDIQRVEIEVKPTPPPARKSAEDIPSEFGMCGAGEMRAEIGRMEAEIEELQKQAAKTTVALPEAASWDGLRHRAQVEHAVEVENRRLVNLLLAAAVRADVPVKAAGVEGSVVILELRGGAKERIRFQKQLDPKVLEGIKPAETERPGLIRMMYVNRVAQRRANPQGGGPGGPGGPGQGPGPAGGHGPGHDHGGGH